MTTPAEVKDLLVALGDDHVVEYNDTAEAVEWRTSMPTWTPALPDDGGE